MKSSLLQDKNDIIGMRDLRQRLGTKATIVDFEEQILLTSIRNNSRIWKEDNHIVGFAFVDEYCNLWFETEKDF